jgi:RHS repeat-associated protein
MTNSSAGVSPVFSYQYDAENRLVRALSNGVAVLECWYDGAGQRIAKREVIGTQTNTWQYIWDGWNLVAVLGVDGKLKEFYTRGVGIAGDIGTLVAVRHWTNVISGPLYYLHNNHHGDVIVVRQGTTTQATLEYTPYGELRSYSGSYAVRFRFSSKEWDTSAGLYHYPYRYYAPNWARWITCDPLGESSGFNLYEFVGNNPVAWIDVLGDEDSSKPPPIVEPPKKPEPDLGKLIPGWYDPPAGIKFKICEKVECKLKVDPTKPGKGEGSCSWPLKGGKCIISGSGDADSGEWKCVIKWTKPLGGAKKKE